jgi:CPA2 family monovalent cation:H+ antiporter-2/glutathione-regulated potassium-efflux system protein KefB
LQARPRPPITTVFTAIVTLSMATTPFLMMITARIREEPKRSEDREGPQADGANALVVGYGRFGQTVAQMLLAADIPVTLIDTDAEMIDVAGEFGAKVYFGDGTRLDLLRQAGAAEAEAILFCLDGEQPDAALIRAVHEAFPNAGIFVRAYDRRMLVALRDAPVDFVVREVMESAVQMVRAALEHLGDSAEDIDRAETYYRKNDRERLDIQKDKGDIRAARDQTITQRRRNWAEAGSEI